jgi:hypothetical protein
MMAEAPGALRPGAGERGALRAWLVLVAPGLLVTRGGILLAVIAAPLLTASVRVALVARVTAAGLLLAQVASTRLLLRRRGPRSEGVFVTFLAIDVLLAGVLLAAEGRLWGAGVPIAVVALAMSFEVAGWASAGVGALLLSAGFAATRWFEIGAPLVWPDALMFGTTLSVETSYAGLPVVEAAVRSFPTALHVETSFGGTSGLGWTATLLLPVWAIALAALSIGVAVNVVRVRRARMLHPALAGHWAMNRGSVAAPTIMLLVLVSVSPASAQCDPSGRAAFVEGLELLSHGNLPAATRIFFQLVQAQPACPEARNNLAVLFVEQERFDEAAVQLQRALQVNPAYERARVNLARVEALLKERQTWCDRAAPTATPVPSPTGRPEGESTAVATAAEVTPQATPQAEGTTAAMPHPEPTPTSAPESDPRGVASPPPSGTPTEPPADAVCALEPAPGRDRVCQRESGQANSRLRSSCPYPCFPRAAALLWQRLRLGAPMFCGDPLVRNAG